MAKLTSERVNGIRSGYWSPAKKEELAQRLGALEHRGPEMLSDICDHYCKYTERYAFSTEQRMELCDNCPMNHLLVMMGGVIMEYSKEQILRLADSLEICADPQRGCGECMFDKTCDRGQENGGAILKEAAKVIRAQADLLNYQETVIGHLKEALAGPEGTAVRSLGCARDDKAMMSADREEDAGEGQAWQMDLYERAIEKFGEEKQIQKAIEEMGELIVELSRWLNAERPADEHLLSHIREELADVCVMTDQLQLIFGDVSDWEMYKLERLERKLVKGL